MFDLSTFGKNEDRQLQKETLKLAFMKKVQFPVFKTKSLPYKKFDLNDPAQRKAYYEFKAGSEIEKLQAYLKDNTFVAILLGKKNSGKGTFSKGFAEALGMQDRIAHLSVGDLVRSVHTSVETDPKFKEELMVYLKKNYRGYISVDQAIDALLGRNQSTLLPDEFILTLIKREIDKIGPKAIFIDGFPRNLDQVSYSLFIRDLIGYRDDPDFLVMIDIPETVIDERIKYRVICPKCHTPRNLKLLPTKDIEYDAVEKKFSMLCDNPECGKAKMVGKEGDELGIEPIRDRLEMDENLIAKAFQLHGIPKILLRNSVPVAEVDEMVDDYEITPEYVFKWDDKLKKVKVSEKPYVVNDDLGTPSHSLLPPPVVVALIKQLADLLP
jgi:adenylate kinase family enzyme